MAQRERLALWLLRTSTAETECERCGRQIPAGRVVAWQSSSRRYFHLTCATLPQPSTGTVPVPFPHSGR